MDLITETRGTPVITMLKIHLSWNDVLSVICSDWQYFFLLFRTEYNEIKDKPGDSLYVRCGFDRSGNEMTDPPQLSFTKDDVLYVDNTMFSGVPGQWRAWRLDGEGHRQQVGVIPSKYKVEEELLLKRGAGDPLEG